MFLHTTSRQHILNIPYSSSDHKSQPFINPTRNKSLKNILPVKLKQKQPPKLRIKAAHWLLNSLRRMKVSDKLCLWDVHAAVGQTDRAKPKLQAINLHVVGVIFPSTVRITPRNQNLKQKLSVGCCLKLKYGGLWNQSRKSREGRAAELEAPTLSGSIVRRFEPHLSQLVSTSPP